MTRPCIVCRGEVFAFLARDGAYEWEECRGCGYVRVSRAFSLAEAVASEDEDAARMYIEGYRRKFASKMARVRRRARRMRRRARGDAFLDVGSNYGFMVAAAEEAGFRAVGVEVSAPLVEAARQQFPGRSFLQGALEAQDFAARRFDAVYCSEVIEHTSDPRLFLERIAAVMRSGGILYLTTPHIREYRRRDYAGMAAPGHKLYFNEANITRLLEECGFATVRHDFTFFRGIKLWATRA